LGQSINPYKNREVQLELLFIGFEFPDKKVNNLFKATYSQQEALYDLDKWNEFETLNPSLFSGMYQFWVQKV
jgi:hypothetical protein